MRSSFSRCWRFSLRWVVFAASFWVLWALITPCCAPLKVLAPRFAEAAATGKVDPSALAAVDQAIQRVRDHPLDASATPWAIMHGILAFGSDYAIRDDRSRSYRNALAFIAQRATIMKDGKRAPLLGETNGYPHFLYDASSQGHENQFLMILASVGAAQSFSLRTDAGRQARVADLLRQAKIVFRRDQHPAWTTVAFIHYLGGKAAWRNVFGDEFSIADLVELLVRFNDPVEGGMHRLYGLAYAHCRLDEARRSQAPPWRDVRAVLRERLAAAGSWRSDDGLFRGTWWRTRGQGNGAEDGIILKTGHMLEWLTLACGRLACKAGWLRKTAVSLARRLLQGEIAGEGPGALFHAAHGLRLWRASLARPAAKFFAHCGAGRF